MNSSRYSITIKYCKGHFTKWFDVTYQVTDRRDTYSSGILQWYWGNYPSTSERKKPCVYIIEWYTVTWLFILHASLRNVFGFKFIPMLYISDIEYSHRQNCKMAFVIHNTCCTSHIYSIYRYMCNSIVGLVKTAINSFPGTANSISWSFLIELWLLFTADWT